MIPSEVIIIVKFSAALSLALSVKARESSGFINDAYRRVQESLVSMIFF